MNMRAPEGVILLAAGSGTRLAPLTDNCHKALLPIAGSPVLKFIIDKILSVGVEDVVVVTGHRHDDIETFVRQQYADRVRCVFNVRYKDDINILSMDLGVNSLRDPDAGYMVVETDMVIEPRGWGMVLDIEDRSRSFWATRGRYSVALTGGTLHADASGRVTDLVYRPYYDSACEGWLKLLGILYVGSAQVVADRSIRRAAMDKSIAQYYMMPWVENLAQLPCLARDLGDVYAVSYNDMAAYRRADEEYTRILRTQGACKCRSR
jgi:NDP-sugar pyrophosphorylase family protein